MMTDDTGGGWDGGGRENLKNSTAPNIAVALTEANESGPLGAPDARELSGGGLGRGLGRRLGTFDECLKLCARLLDVLLPHAGIPPALARFVAVDVAIFAAACQASRLLW